MAERIDIIRKRSESLNKALARRDFMGSFKRDVYDDVLSGLVSLEDAKSELRIQNGKSPYREVKTSYKSMINRII